MPALMEPEQREIFFPFFQQMDYANVIMAVSMAYFHSFFSVTVFSRAYL
jgi:hypothetical protein